MIKHFYSIFISIFIVNLCLSATYYLNTASTGSGDGTTIATTGDHAAWKAISEITGLAAGDTILFNKGDTWREQLTVPASGSSGSPITFGAYGTGDNPIINGADIVSTWTENAAWVTSWTSTPSGQWVNASPCDYNLRAVIASGSATETGTKVKISIKGGISAETLDGCSIGLRSGAGQDYASAPTRVTFSSSNTVAIGANATVVSDEIEYSFNDSVDHLVHLWWDDGVSGAYQSSGGDTFYREAAIEGGLTDQTMVQDTSWPDEKTGWKSPVVNIDVYQTVANVWQATCTTEPYQVFFDGIKGTKAENVASIDSENEWYWDSNLLYVYYTEDPDGAATIEAGARQNCIAAYGKSYLTFENLELVHSNGTIGNGGSGIEISYGPNTGITIQDCVIHHHNWDGIWIEGTSGNETTNCMIQGNTVHHCSLNELGSGAIHSDYLNDSTMQDNVCYENSEQAFRLWNSDDNIIQNNTCYSNGSSGIAVVGHDGGTSGGNIIRYNLCYGNSAIDPEKSNIELIHSGGDNEIYYNIMYGSQNHGIRTDTADGDYIYNNVIYDSADVGIFIGNNSANLTIKNNIIMTSGNQHIKVLSNSLVGHEIDYNWYSADGATKFSWDASDYNFADWKTNSSQDADSIVQDPLFVDASSNNFRLQSSSPCIDAGVDVGLTQDYSGNQVGTIPDIGAYESAEEILRSLRARFIFELEYNSNRSRYIFP